MRLQSKSARLHLPVSRHFKNDGLSIPEVIVTVGILGTLLCLLFPFLLQLRESSRQGSCQNNLRHLTAALRSYHDTHQQFPPAAIWNTNVTTSIALHSSKRVELITQQNWIQLLLPHLGETSLAEQFDPSLSVGDDHHLIARTTRLKTLVCPSDPHNRSENQHEYYPSDNDDVHFLFARGNYAINGGTQNHELLVPTTAHPRGETAHLLMDEENRRYQLWGNGLAGINKSFSSEDFANGQSTMVALEEIRAGIHPFDPRGTWALGQIGASITWAHGINGDNFGPNNQWARADDIIGCGTLHEVLGPSKLEQEEMPCVHYVDANQQATARSKHEGGVNVSFLDGSVRFISNQVDPGLWHVMHSRETPQKILSSEFEARLNSNDFIHEAEARLLTISTQSKQATDQKSITNSIGMEFVIIPAGKFQMGIPDIGNNSNPPPEVPEHHVQIAQDFYLGVYEVTTQQFEALHNQKGGIDSETSTVSEEGNNHPIVNITWNQAESFCDSLSEIPAEKTAGRRYRLPTEAEWEYACRVGKSDPYRWKSKRPTDDQSGEAVGITPPLPLKPVGSYPPNELGLFDMRGNAWEWTSDWFDRDYYTRSSTKDPQGPANGFIKVVRGADWRFTGGLCRIDYPMLPPWKSNPMVGFRIVCELVEQP